MTICAMPAHQDQQQSDPRGVALAATLLELLGVARSKVELDRPAAQACLSRAMAILEASLEKRTEPEAQCPFRGGLPHWQAKRLTTFIENNLAQPIRSPDLIALTGLSTGHFFRTFKETFGQAPFAYIARQRIERAQKMMLTTEKSLCQIALDCGMCDQSHLTRLFRQQVGTTPGEWRRAYARESLDTTSVNGNVTDSELPISARSSRLLSSECLIN